MEVLRCTDDVFAQDPLTLTGGPEDGVVIATFPRPASRGGRNAARARSDGNPAAEISGMVGDSPVMKAVFNQIRLVARADVTVMVIGESGTGKELAAHAIHELGERRRGPFIAVNCGAIPANLAEAELFGHEKGSFTGAQRQHIGHFERASGGTLFLDEVTEMPPELQVKLLRVLETGRFTRVGGTDEIDVDVRLVTATNRDPYQAVREGRLREDLLYRLAVFPLNLPALRERGEDVVRLGEFFLERLNAKYGASKRFSPAALAQMRAHHWPGNVRELRNCVERSFILSDEEVELEITRPGPTAGPRVGSDGCVRVPLGSTVADAEREMILATIDHCGGNKRKAADVLGISVKTVYNKLAEYGMAEGTIRLAAAN
jgi:DNA-binding NtrC family response regulator